jgi:hypothetical protein
MFLITSLENVLIELSELVVKKNYEKDASFYC